MRWTFTATSLNFRSASEPIKQKDRWHEGEAGISDRDSRMAGWGQTVWGTASLAAAQSGEVVRGVLVLRH